jgi:hypothetical protein
VSTEDVRPLLLGDRHVFGDGFDRLLMQLSLVPAGSVKTLNIVAHCTSIFRLDFAVEFIHTRGTDTFDDKVEDDAQRPFKNVDLSDLVNLLSSPDINVGGVPVKLSDVRKAFPVDAEVHVFNMSNPLREEFLQALANVFQVRTTGFSNKPVRVNATILGEAGDEATLLAKKIDIGFIGDPVGTEVDFFVNLLGQDRAQTGLFTAFPKRS